MYDRGIGPTPFGSEEGPLTQMAIAAARSGDPEGTHYLYVRFGARVLGHVQTLVSDPESAEEVTRAVFVGLAEAISARDAGEISFEAWLLEEARRRALAYAPPDPSPPASARSSSAR